MAQNGTAVQQSRSRSGLLVAKEMLDDKLSEDGRVSVKEPTMLLQIINCGMLHRIRKCVSSLDRSRGRTQLCSPPHNNAS